MARDYPRHERVAEQIRRELAQLLLTELKDPRSKLVTITAVEVSRDLGVAKVYASQLGVDSIEPEALQGLESASGFLRSQLGRRMKLRIIPELRFQADNSLQHGAHIDALIEYAIHTDTNKRQPD